MSLTCGVAEGFALLLAPLRNKKTPFVQIGTDHSAVPPKLCKKHLSIPLTRGTRCSSQRAPGRHAVYSPQKALQPEGLPL